MFKGKIEPAWVQEAIQRLPEFQARWDKEGPAYFAVARRETGLDYPFREVQATLDLSPVLRQMVKAQNPLNGE